jgi:hypothetical protein
MAESTAHPSCAKRDTGLGGRPHSPRAITPLGLIA